MSAEKQSQHEIVADIKRVAKELGRSPTRDEYLSKGNFSQRQIRNHFNGFSSALKQSGLTPRTTKESVPSDIKAIIKSKESFQKRKNLETLFDEQITPYIGKYDKPHKEILTIIAGSDFHSVWADPFCLHVFIDSCKRIQPDVIALVGDVFDFYAISSFSKDPSRLMKLQAEIDYVVKYIFKPLREACPNSQIDLFIGNHEWRLFKYLAGEATGLSSLRCLQFNELLELDQYQINLVAKKSFLTKKESAIKNYKVYKDLYVLTHGTSIAKLPAMIELKKYNLSGASGHVHRHQVYFERDLSGEKAWTSMGCMCRLESGEEYIHDIVTWNQGFEIAHINTRLKKVVKEYVHINDGFAIVGGVYYTDKKRAGYEP